MSSFRYISHAARCWVCYQLAVIMPLKDWWYAAWLKLLPYAGEWAYWNRDAQGNKINTKGEA